MKCSASFTFVSSGTDCCNTLIRKCLQLNLQDICVHEQHCLKYLIQRCIEHFCTAREVDTGSLCTLVNVYTLNNATLFFLENFFLLCSCYYGHNVYCILPLSKIKDSLID